MANHDIENVHNAAGTVDNCLSILSEMSILINSSKSVALMIRNRSNAQLCKPSSYATSGKIYTHLPYTIGPANEETLGFQKTPYGLCGAEGVVVYQLGNTIRYLCIFYCVPFIGANGFYLKWKTGQGIEADETLCSEMAKDQWDIEGGIKWHSANTEEVVDNEVLNCHGFMTQTDNAQMIVDVSN